MKKYTKGLSLIEILIAIAIFAVLGMLVASSLILTIQGSKKSESLIKVREELNYSMTIIERNLRSASSIAPGGCLNTTVINYYDQNQVPASFSCEIGSQDDSWIASNSARLTSDAIQIINCSFVCDPNDQSLVTLNVTARSKSSTGAQGAEVSAQKNIYIRSK